MRVRHLSAFVILLAWQSAPLPRLVTDDSGQVRWTLSAMAGSGQWEDATYGCEGQLLSANAAKYTDVGARVDLTSADRLLRVTAVAGHSSLSRGGSGAGPGNATTLGALAAVETRPVGLGMGVAGRPTEGGAIPSLYLRLGDRDKTNLRLELEPLSETRTMAGDLRLGLGFPAGSAGLVYSPYYQNSDQLAGYLDLALPVSRTMDLRVGGTYGPGARVSQWGVAAGLRIHP